MGNPYVVLTVSIATRIWHVDINARNLDSTHVNDLKYDKN